MIITNNRSTIDKQLGGYFFMYLMTSLSATSKSPLSLFDTKRQLPSKGEP
jgi:hypothetical protein